MTLKWVPRWVLVNFRNADYLLTHDPKVSLTFDIEKVSTTTALFYPTLGGVTQETTPSISPHPSYLFFTLALPKISFILENAPIFNWASKCTQQFGVFFGCQTKCMGYFSTKTYANSHHFWESILTKLQQNSSCEEKVGPLVI